MPPTCSAPAGSAGPLTGIPVAHKDVLMTAGLRTTCGSRMLEHFVAPYDAFVVQRLAAAGMVLIGKTNMDEFAMGSSNENSYFGPVRNPWNRDCVPGGSSGGSAAAVAARLVPAATGTDTGGSIRQPAALSGVCGLKPTYGVCSRYGLVAFASSLDTPGVFAQTAQDCALLLNAMAGHDARDSTCLDRPAEDYARDLSRAPLQGLRIGLPREYFAGGTEAGVLAAIEDALVELRRLGATTVDIGLPNVELAVPVYYVIAPAEASSNLSRFDGVRYGHRAEHYTDLLDMYKKTRAEGFGAEVKRRILVGTYVLSHGYYDAYYLKAQQVRRLIADDFRRAYEQCDVILGPTAPTYGLRARRQDRRPGADVPQRHFHHRRQPHRRTGAVDTLRLRRSRTAGRDAAAGQLFPRSAAARTSRTAISRRPTGTRACPGGVSAMTRPEQWEVVIGLETHTQLSTASKIFSGASTAFGAAPNTQASAVDIALPGVLPVLNKGAVERAIRFGLAVGATINRRSVFARKNYFYPDLPKGYQISQYEIPVVQGGEIAIVSPTRGEIKVRLTRAHLEEDAGKSLHEGSTSADTRCAATCHRHRPQSRRHAAARDRVRARHAQRGGSGRLREGAARPGALDRHLRRQHAGRQLPLRRQRLGAAARVSTKLGTRCEIKNLNSFRFMQDAIEFEVRRQIELIEDGGTVVQETRLYDPDQRETRSMRSKEDAQDYRYFPDPDLPPLVIDEEWIERIQAEMPELPAAKRTVCRRIRRSPRTTRGSSTASRRRSRATSRHARAAPARRRQARRQLDARRVLRRAEQRGHRDRAKPGVRGATRARLLQRIARRHDLRQDRQGRVRRDVGRRARRRRRRDHRQRRACGRSPTPVRSKKSSTKSSPPTQRSSPNTRPARRRRSTRSSARRWPPPRARRTRRRSTRS